jgi:hypothetical protein
MTLLPSLPLPPLSSRQLVSCNGIRYDPASSLDGRR